MRGQSTFLDFGTGFLLFAIVLVISGSYLTTRTEIRTAPDGSRISNELLSEGSPRDWNASTVVVPGILTNGSVDQQKWMELSGMDPHEIRSLLFLSGDTYIRITRYHEGRYIELLPPITTATVSYEGISNEDHDSISVTSRITTYAGSLAVLEVITWL